jgi:hypothetical protein
MYPSAVVYCCVLLSVVGCSCVLLCVRGLRRSPCSCVECRIGVHPKMLDPDPDEMNTDPQP